MNAKDSPRTVTELHPGYPVLVEADEDQTEEAAA